MSRYDRTDIYETPRRGYRRRWASPVLPWMFVIAVVAATTLPVREWVRRSLRPSAVSQAERDAGLVWRRASGSVTR